MRLFTFQMQGHDITKSFKPSVDYLPGGIYFDIVQDLGWPTWIWTFTSIQDFLTDKSHGWMNTDLFKHCRLWVLEVPPAKIAWLGIDEFCSPGGGRIKPKFEYCADMIRLGGDIPMGLVEAPIQEGWVTAIYEPS